MISIFSFVGSLAAIFSGVFRAIKPVDVMSLIGGKFFGDEDSMNRVPLAIYMSRKSVHPGACETIDVSGKRIAEPMGVGAGFANGISSIGWAVVVGGSRSRPSNGLGGILSTGAGVEPKVEWVLMFIEGRSKGIREVNICMEIAPRRMRIASLLVMIRRKVGMTAEKHLSHQIEYFLAACTRQTQTE
jgi:hypothetical protein